MTVDGVDDRFELVESTRRGTVGLDISVYEITRADICSYYEWDSAVSSTKWQDTFYIPSSCIGTVAFFMLR